VKGRLYRVGCRNLWLAVFNGKSGFIGIREKFDNEYLDTEHHAETGPPHGTVYRAVDTGIDLPGEIEPLESLGTVDMKTDRDLEYIDDGWYRFVDTGEKAKYPDINQAVKSNRALFEWIKEREEEFTPGEMERRAAENRSEREE
jgi:hypothetical protein